MVFWKPTGLIPLELGTIRDTLSHTAPGKSLGGQLPGTAGGIRVDLEGL